MAEIPKRSPADIIAQPIPTKPHLTLFRLSYQKDSQNSPRRLIEPIAFDLLEHNFQEARDDLTTHLKNKFTQLSNEQNFSGVITIGETGYLPAHQLAEELKSDQLTHLWVNPTTGRLTEYQYCRPGEYLFVCNVLSDATTVLKVIDVLPFISLDIKCSQVLTIVDYKIPTVSARFEERGINITALTTLSEIINHPSFESTALLESAFLRRIRKRSNLAKSTSSY